MVHVYDLCSVRYLLDRSSSHARRHCTPVGTWCWASSVLQPACPGTLCTLQSLSLCSIFLCSYPSLLLPFFLSCLTYSLTSSFLCFSPVSPTLQRMTPYRLEISLGRDKVKKQLGRRRPIVCWNCEKQGHPCEVSPTFRSRTLNTN